VRGGAGRSRSAPAGSADSATASSTCFAVVGPRLAEGSIAESLRHDRVGSRSPAPWLFRSPLFRVRVLGFTGVFRPPAGGLRSSVDRLSFSFSILVYCYYGRSSRHTDHTERHSTHTDLRRTVPQLLRRPSSTAPPTMPAATSAGQKLHGKRLERDGTSALAATDVVLIPIAAPVEQRPQSHCQCRRERASQSLTCCRQADGDNAVLAPA
jgi:hypothetical protein